MCERTVMFLSVCQWLKKNYFQVYFLIAYVFFILQFTATTSSCVHFNDLLFQMILIKLAYSRKRIHEVVFLNQPYSLNYFLMYEKAVITFDYS